MNRCLVACLAAAALGAGAQAVGQSLEGPDSVYTDKLVQLLERWPASRPEPDSSVPLELTCIATAGDDRYVGMQQRTTIHAALSVVASVLDDVPHYKDLFPDVVDVRVVPGSRQGDRYLTAWRQRAPAFFLPELGYELAYRVDRRTPGRVVYRYKLRRGDTLTASDGMVVLEDVAPHGTRFTEFDFFNADWGLLPVSVIWIESLKGSFLSDVAIKLKAENSLWSYERIATEARRLLESEAAALDRCFDRRHEPAPGGLF